MNNNMNFNWEKKISLKEIAQFYEDKLRELDAKEAYIDNKTLELERKIMELKKEVDDSEAFWDYMKEHITQAIKSVIPSYVDEYLKKNEADKDSAIYDFVYKTMNSILEVLGTQQKEYLDNRIKSIQNELNGQSSFIISYTLSNAYLVTILRPYLPSGQLEMDLNDFKHYLSLSPPLPTKIKDLSILQYKSLFGDMQAKIQLAKLLMDEVEK